MTFLIALSGDQPAELDGTGLDRCAPASDPGGADFYVAATPGQGLSPINRELDAVTP
jgi:hypothetical protein